MEKKSRKEAIPRDLLVRWRSSDTRRSRPVARRPRTACSSCRALRVRCNGQKGCERCSREGVPCRYTTDNPTLSPPAPLTPPSPPPPPPPPHPPSAGLTVPAPPKAPGTELLLADQTTPLNAAPFDNGEQLGYQFDPDYLERLLDSPFLPLHIDPLSLTGCPPHSASTDMESLTPDVSPRSDTAEEGEEEEQEEEEECSCRLRLLKFPSAMQSAAAGASQPDEVYKATDDVISYLKDVLFCPKCQTSLADLVCIISIFQETGKSWEKLLRVDGFSTVKVTIGGREIAVSDQNCIRRILVTDLVNQAEALLDAIQTTAEKVVSLQPEPLFLDQVNVTYLSTIDGHLRDLFLRVKGAMEVPLA